MMNLLSVDWMRARKAWFFWVMLIIAAAVSMLIFQEHYSMIVAETPDGKSWPMKGAFFQFPILNGALLSAFVPLFLGADYSDGTIRNKLIAGHQRSSIYGSYLLTTLISSGILNAVILVFNMTIGLLNGGKMSMDSGQLALYLCTAFCCSFAFASLFVLISTQITNRAFSSVACIGIVLLMFLLSSKLISELYISPEARDLLTLVDGKPVYSDPYPNPMYVSGVKRTLIEVLVDVLPTGQSIQMSNVQADRINRFPILSALFILLTSGIGVFAFRKKDIR